MRLTASTCLLRLNTLRWKEMSCCPACQNTLTPIATASGESFLICLDCGGRAVSLPLLESSVSPITYKRLMNQFKNTKGVVERVCPVCSARMKRIHLEILGRDHGVEICPNCQTTWFDHKEFEHLPLTSKAEEEFKLPPEIQSALNEIEVQHGVVVANRTSFRLDARDFGIGWDRTREGRPSGWKLLLGLMLIPVERESHPDHNPWATWILLVLVSMVSYVGFHNMDLVEALGLHSNHIWKWDGLTLLSYFFVHGGWEHLLGNMYYLWLFGDNVEEEIGALPYLGVLACGTAGGALLHAFLDPNPGALLIGASGGISTLGMIYMLRFPRAKLALFVLFRWVRVPAYILMVIWVLLQLKMAADQVGGITQVSALCHVGGALVGVIAYYALSYGKGRGRLRST